MREMKELEGEARELKGEVEREKMEKERIEGGFGNPHPG